MRKICQIFFLFLIFMSYAFAFEDIIYAKFLKHYKNQHKEDAIVVGKDFLSSYPKSNHWNDVYLKLKELDPSLPAKDQYFKQEASQPETFYDMKAGCEGECCGLLSSNKVHRPFTVYEKPDVASKKVAMASKGETLKKIEFYLKIVSHGEALYKGKKVAILQYISEGWYQIQDSAGDVKEVEGGELANIKSAQTEEWIKVNIDGKFQGWAPIPAHGSNGATPHKDDYLYYKWCG